ncbi:hypothetical protein IGI37_000892 [Enterococcus sp. AZ194]|uniref:hypothetical protein n=1 Tax=Enterococcus sp. AZ194 TaxID=2774629 RepID=UPI003F23D5D8
MNKAEKEQFVKEIVDELIKRKGNKIKIKTQTMKLKKKFDTRAEAKEYEQQFREKYSSALFVELTRILEGENTTDLVRTN